MSVKATSVRPESIPDITFTGTNNSMSASVGDPSYLEYSTFDDEFCSISATGLPDLIQDDGIDSLLQGFSAAQAMSDDTRAGSVHKTIQVSSSNTLPPKLGGRFSKGVIRILKNWLALHKHHPYPIGEQMDILIEQTRINKTQIMNWFANARRRDRVQKDISASSPVLNESTTPIDIIARPGTPAPKQRPAFVSPLQRWVDSPPEDEAASVGAIARAMSSRLADDIHCLDFTQDDLWLSGYDNSSGSSAGTSNSSLLSGVHLSGSQSPLPVARPTRKRRTRKHRRAQKKPIVSPAWAYQCTFCTETFKTKHDWQRHEKSLHLPLEQWVCGLHGPRAPRPGYVGHCCVFCGDLEPDEVHLQGHCYSACQQKSAKERTFHRKDHLNQHLRLIHNVKYADWSMSQWRMSLPDVRSRCGFCGTDLSTWTERADHLAEHFKSGKSMADWEGEWGFDAAILRIVESAYPPYLINFERNTVAPYGSSPMPLYSPINAYDLLKVEMECYVQEYYHRTKKLPDNDDLQFEACRIVFASESFSDRDLSENPTSSWLRDLIMSSPRLSKQAKFGPIRLCSEGRLPTLKINGKDSLFEQCQLENQLSAFVESQKAAGVPIFDLDLQDAACEAIRYMERESTTSSNLFANWLVRLVHSNADWLSGFKCRTGLPQFNDTSLVDPRELLKTNCDNEVASSTQFQLDDFTWDGDWPSLPAEDSANSTATSTKILSASLTPIHASTLFRCDSNFYGWFVRDLARWASATMSPNNPTCHVPSDQEIQHQARWVMYDGDDPCDQTIADSPEWLRRFKKDAGITVEHDSNPDLESLGLGDGALVPASYQQECVSQTLKDLDIFKP